MLEKYRHIPMVVMDWGVEKKADFTDTVIDNAFAGGYMAGRCYLVEARPPGYRRYSGPLGLCNTGAGRLASFMKAMEEALISVPDNWLFRGDFEPESGYHAMANFIAVTSPYRRFSAAAILWRWARFARLDRQRLRVPTRTFR